LDISLENFVAHFDDDGQFLVKLIDFGRAKTMKKKEGAAASSDQWPYEAFDFTVSTFPGKLRYMSPEAAMFLKFKDADSYDASKEDIYALGVALYVMLTGTMPWDSPLFLERDPTNPMVGHLNGSKKFKIDMVTMKESTTGHFVDSRFFDANFQQLQTARGLIANIHSNGNKDYFTRDALDLLCRIFECRMSLKELSQHPFVCTPPGPVMAQAIHRLAATKRAGKERDLRDIPRNIQKMVAIDNQRLTMKAALMTVNQRGKKNCSEQPICAPTLHPSTSSVSFITSNEGTSRGSSMISGDDLEGTSDGSRYISLTPTLSET